MSDSLITAVVPTTVTVTLNFPASGLPLLWDWINHPRYPNCDDTSPKTLKQFMAVMPGVLDVDITFGLMADDKLIGYIGFKRVDVDAGYFRGIVIAPEYRQKGLGTAAVKIVIGLLKSMGILVMQATFFLDNHPIAYVFQKLGWKCINVWSEPSITRDGKISPLAVWGPQ